MPAIDNLTLRVSSVHVCAGDEVVRQRDQGDRFYVIEEGRRT